MPACDESAAPPEGDAPIGHGKADTNGDPGPQLLFSEGLDAPESVAWDPDSQTWFVSNLAHNILETDPLHPPEGNIGFISRHDADGQLIEQRWFPGLTSPKGLLVHRGVLYVADPQAVVAVDIDTGYERDRFTHAEAGLFNDIAPVDAYTLAVTDTGNPGLYLLHLDGDGLQPLVRDPRFEFPNGVAVDGGTAYVCTTGLFPSEQGPGTDGRVFEVDLDTGETDEVEGIRGKWDGIVVLDDGRLATNDFMTGQLRLTDPYAPKDAVVIEPPFTAKMPPLGLADMNAARGMLILPSMFTHEVYAYVPEKGGY